MTSSVPPNPWYNGIIYNPDFFKSNTDTITIAYANATYLRRIGNPTSIATLTTFTGSVSVQGTSSFGNILSMNSATLANRVINNIDYRLQDLATGSFVGQIYSNGNTLNVINSVNSGSQKFYTKDAGGTSTDVLTISSSGITSREVLTLNGTVDTDRIINNVYYQFQDKTSLSTTVGQMYGSAGSMIFDNDINSGLFSFATNNSVGTQSIPLTLSSAQNTLSSQTLVQVSAGGSPVVAFNVRDLTSSQNLQVIPATTSGILGPFTRPGDVQIASVGSAPGNTNLTIMPYSNNTVGIRLTNTSVLIGAGGTASFTPTSNILFSGTTISATGTLTMNNNAISGALNFNGIPISYGAGLITDNNISIGSSNLTGSATNGGDNIAIGKNCLIGTTNVFATNNIALGASTLQAITSGSNNLGIGSVSMSSLSTGNYNTAIGYQANQNQLTGDNNVAIGRASGASFPAGQNASNSTAIGYQAQYTGSNQIVLGTSAQTTFLKGPASFSSSIILQTTAPTNTSGYLGYNTKLFANNTGAITTNVPFNNITAGFSLDPGVYIFNCMLYDVSTTAGDINEIISGISTSSTAFVGGAFTSCMGFQTYTVGAKNIVSNYSLTFTVPATATYFYLQSVSHTLSITNNANSSIQYTRVA